MLKRMSVVASFLLPIGLSGCGGSSAAGGQTGGPPSTTTIRHVGVVVFENQNYSDAVGSAAMPYFNSLISSGGLATQFFANVHPSMGNYFMMTTGQICLYGRQFHGQFLR